MLVAKFMEVDRDSSVLGTPRKRLLLRETRGLWSFRAGLEGWALGIGDGALDEDEVERLSSQLGFAAEGSGWPPSSSLVRRRFRGRKVVELLAEAVEEDSVMATKAKCGLSPGLTWGYR